MNREQLNKLTGRAKQLAMVQNDDLWPHWPVLPMIRVERQGEYGMAMENCGLLRADQGPRIYPGNLITGPTRGATIIQYLDWDGLLDDWRVD